MAIAAAMASTFNKFIITSLCLAVALIRALNVSVKVYGAPLSSSKRMISIN